MSKQMELARLDGILVTGLRACTKETRSSDDLMWGLYALKEYNEAMPVIIDWLSNTEILCFVMGQQGGTVHDVARDLGVGVDDIVNAGHARMQELCRIAQSYRMAEGTVQEQAAFHLKICLKHLENDYQAAGATPEDYPTWLKKAIEIGAKFDN